MPVLAALTKDVENWAILGCRDKIQANPRYMRPCLRKKDEEEEEKNE